MKYFILLFSIFILISHTGLSAQNNVVTNDNIKKTDTFPIGKNYGLSVPQDSATLPYSRFDSLYTIIDNQSYHKPIRLSEKEYCLNQGWVLTADETYAKRYRATVPGTVLTTLVNQGEYEDPYFGLNMMKIPDDLCRKNWIYTLKFKSPEKNSKNVFLNFQGINYMADVFLNNISIGRIEGAFKKGIFNISSHIRDENELKVIIYPPNNPGIPHEQSARTSYGPNGGVLCLDGPTFISSEGWDWMPGIRDRNIGIWQDVSLSYTDDIRLSDMQIITDLNLPDTTQALVTVNIDVSNLSPKRQKTTLLLHIAGMQISKQVEMSPQSKQTISFTPPIYSELCLNNPKLWWPNGYGEPHLYEATVSASVNKVQSDKVKERFGIREVSFEMLIAETPDSDKHVRVDYDPLQWLQNNPYPWDNGIRVNLSDGISIPTFTDKSFSSKMPVIKDNTNPYLVVKVNGVPIFCRGGNWGMDDAMKKVSRLKMEPYIKLHKEAGFNMIRNWTGESTEKVFFDLCDEYGILVWNDFWYSTLGFNLEPEDKNLFMDNVKDVIVRYRNHPSLIIWCPRNEGYARPELETELVEATSKIDGTRLYIGSSRYLNLRSSGPWDYKPNESVYFTQIAEGFSTELGTMAVPLASSMKKMMSEADLWPIGDVWYYHDFYFGKWGYSATIDSLYGEAVSMPDFCKKAQLINYNSHRAMFEAWNNKLWKNTSGLLLWMSHPAWPSTVWQTYSWDYETTGAYYGAKKACEPFHIQMNAHDYTIAVVNTTNHNRKNILIEMKAYSLSNEVLYSERTNIDLNANSRDSVHLSFIEKLRNTNAPYLLRLKLIDEEEILSLNEYWLTGKSGTYRSFNDLPYTGLEAKIIYQNDNLIYFKLYNPTSTPAIGIKIKVVDIETEKEILPVSVSDGYFTLMPQEERILIIDQTLSPKANLYGIYTEGYNIQTGIIQTYK